VKGFEPSTFTLATGRPIAQPVETTEAYGHAEATPGDSLSDSAAKPAADGRLAHLIDAWPDLSEAVRAGIAAIVEASR